jgi:hypothetical protein
MAVTLRIKIVLLAVVLVAFFLSVLLVALPAVLVNAPQIQAALQQHLGARLGGEVAFDRITLSLFPRVCATVGHARLNRTDGVSAQAAEIDVCVKLLPLLLGRVMAETITLKSPEIHLPTAPSYSMPGDSGFPDPRLLLGRAADLLRQLPEFSIDIADGRLELSGPDGRRFEFLNLDLRLHHAGQRLEWSFQGKSNACDVFSSTGRLETRALEGTARFQVIDFRPQLVQGFFPGNTSFHVLDARLNLDLTVALEGPDRATAAITGKAPVLTLGYNRRETRLSLERFAARLEYSEKRTTVSVSELISRTPDAELELHFISDQKADPKIDIELKGRGELAGVRSFALAMLHEIPDARLVCDILRSGEVPHIQVNLHGNSWNDLTELSNLRIAGRLENGNVYIPWIDLDVSAVSGDALIAAGVLEGRNLKAHCRGTHGENGTLRVGLSQADPVLRLEIQVRAELAPLPALLMQVVPDPVFRREVGHIQEVSGSARGTLRLTGTHTDVSVEVQASELDVKARHPLVPYPLRFQGGTFAYDGDTISLRGVDSAIGGSTLFKHDLRLGLGGDRPIESRSKNAVLHLAELFNLVRMQPLFKDIRRLEGLVTLDNWQLTGQAFAPAAWKLSATGILQDLSVESELLPGRLHLPSGRVDWQGQKIRYQGAQASISRSEANGLTVEANWAGPPRVQLRTVELDVALDDLSQFMQTLPKSNAFAAALFPVSGTARMRDVSLHASFLPGGPRVDHFKANLKDALIASAPIGLPLLLTAGDIGWQDSRLELQIAKASLGRSEALNLSALWDRGIDGALELRTDTAVIECSQTLPRLLTLTGNQDFREDVSDVKGSVHLSDVVLRRSRRDSDLWHVKATGVLNDIAITTTLLEGPVRIPSGRLAASNAQTDKGEVTTLQLDSIRLNHDPHTVTISGVITLSADETQLDLDVAAEDLDWNEIGKISDRIASSQRGESRPVRGRTQLRAEQFQYERFHNSPFHAVGRFDDRGTTVLIERAGFCGLTFIGRISLEGSMAHAYLVPMANALPLDDVITCLTRQQSVTTGSLSLDGALQAAGRHDDMAKALSGRFRLVAEDGTILRSVLFARLFSILNLTEIYRGNFPDFTSQGLDYKRSTATIEIKEGKVLIHDWSIEGPTLWMGSRGEIDIATQKIDFTIIVSPFKTIDRIINSIPGIRWILGGRLVGIPMKATGDIENPDVVALAPSAVGTSILEMLQRMLLLPIEIIQPLIPGMESQEGNTITR